MCFIQQKIKAIISVFIIILLLIVCKTANSQFIQKASFKFPYRKAGLTKRDAVNHLLNRFTFGAKPGQIDLVMNMGPENWLQYQLNTIDPDDSLQKILSPLKSLTLNNCEIAEQYPDYFHLEDIAFKKGLISKDSADKITKLPQDDKVKKEELIAFQMGLNKAVKVVEEQVSQKIFRAIYSNNQLREVLTSFWFNHFNIALTSSDLNHFITIYEKDVIRPNVLGKFETLLLSTAQSPAMLYYLDNFKSIARPVNNNDATKKKIKELNNQLSLLKEKNDTGQLYNEILQKIKDATIITGYNENYAREIMELHTMGVNSGYTQTDVTNAARILTGWTIFPYSDYFGGQQNIRNLIEKIGEDSFAKLGFIHTQDFLFLANKHDNTEKQVLGVTFPANGGYKEGLSFINLIAHHPATAHFICKKIAAHFINETPDERIVQKMASTFIKEDGDIKKVILTMVCDKAFWNKNTAVLQKIKSPFEYAISAVRATNASVTKTNELTSWISKMGERYYYYYFPTGFPYKGVFWINPNNLLNRINFGLLFSSQRIGGCNIDYAYYKGNNSNDTTFQYIYDFKNAILPVWDNDKLGKYINIFTTNDTKSTLKNKPLEMLKAITGIMICSPEFQHK